MKTKQFNIQKPNTQYKLNIKYNGYTSNTIIINSRTVFYVKQLIDGGNDNNDGKTWDTAFSTIAKALEAAKAIVPSETNPVEIWVAAGDYYISKTMAMIKFVSIYGSFEGRETTKNERKILEDETEAETSDKDFKSFKSPLTPTTNIINTNSASTSSSTSRHFTTSLTATTSITPDSVIIDGICFKKAASSSIYNYYASPTFSNCVWYNNSSSTNDTITAGAVYNSYSSPKFYNCQFISNEARSKMGGAIKYDTGDTNESIIDNCIFYNNSSKQDGSAIYVNTNNKIKITNSIIDTNNTINNGFGGSVFINDKATVEITNLYIVFNTDTSTNTSNDNRHCGAGVRLNGNASNNSATLVANNVIFYKNNSYLDTSETKPDYNIGISTYSSNNTNRPTIKLTDCKLSEGNILSNQYSSWFKVPPSSITNVSTTINESDIDANRAKTKINSEYLNG